MGATVLYERDGAVATLTLNRPDRLNAIVPELIGDLDDVRSAVAGRDAPFGDYGQERR